MIRLFVFALLALAAGQSLAIAQSNLDDPLTFGVQVRAIDAKDGTIKIAHTSQYSVCRPEMKTETRTKTVERDGKQMTFQETVSVTVMVCEQKMSRDERKISLTAIRAFNMAGTPIASALLEEKLRTETTVLLATREIPPFYLTVYKTDAILLVVKPTDFYTAQIIGQPGAGPVRFGVPATPVVPAPVPGTGGLPGVPLPLPPNAPVLPVIPAPPAIPALPVIPAPPVIPALPVVPAPPAIPALPVVPAPPAIPAPPVIPAPKTTSIAFYQPGGEEGLVAPNALSPFVVLAQAAKGDVNVRQYVKESGTETIMKEVTVGATKRLVKMEIKVERVNDVERQYPLGAVRFVRADKQEVTPEQITQQLVKPTCVLQSADGADVDPRYLQIVRPDALILIPAMKVPQPPQVIAPAVPVPAAFPVSAAVPVPAVLPMGIPLPPAPGR